MGVKSVVAIRESSDEGFGVRERGSAVMVEGVRREDVQGMLAKKAWAGEGEDVGGMASLVFVVTGMVIEVQGMRLRFLVRIYDGSVGRDGERE